MSNEAHKSEETEPGSQERNGSPEAEKEKESASALGTVIDWIEKNPSLALVGAFAVGVFIGVLVRD